MTTVEAHPHRARASEEELREQLSNMQALLVLSMLMTESRDERQILHLACTAVPSLARCGLEGVYLVDAGWVALDDCRGDDDGRVPDRGAVGLAQVVDQLIQLGAGGGGVAADGRGWTWAFPLRGMEGHLGYLVVSASVAPSPGEQFLLRGLAQQAGIALANARLHASQRATAETLAATVRTLERSTAIHDRLTRVGVAGEG
ncbi:MAG: hypothetical protein M3Q87_08480, partial [Actinomycetota bacterium]|nr:hypothetical protein [Actinomycetota bacterium]